MLCFKGKELVAFPIKSKMESCHVLLPNIALEVLETIKDIAFGIKEMMVLLVARDTIAYLENSRVTHLKLSK